MSCNATCPFDIERSRAGMESAAFSMADDVRVESTSLGGLPVEWVSAPGAIEDRVVFFLHGGGFVLAPETRLQVGAAEILVDDSIFVWHVFAGRVPEATEAVDHLGQFVQQLLRKSFLRHFDKSELLHLAGRCCR